VSKERRSWSSEDKIKLLRRHLIERVPISTICEEARLVPSLFHRWQERCLATPPWLWKATDAPSAAKTNSASRNWNRRSGRRTKSWPS